MSVDSSPRILQDFLKERDMMCSFCLENSYTSIGLSNRVAFFFWSPKRGLYLFSYFCIVSLGTNSPPRVALGRSTSREQVLKYQSLKVTQGITNMYNTALYIVFFLLFLFFSGRCSAPKT